MHILALGGLLCLYVTIQWPIAFLSQQALKGCLPELSPVSTFMLVCYADIQQVQLQKTAEKTFVPVLTTET